MFNKIVFTLYLFKIHKTGNILYKSYQWQKRKALETFHLLVYKLKKKKSKGQQKKKKGIEKLGVI